MGEVHELLVSDLGQKQDIAGDDVGTSAAVGMLYELVSLT